VRDLLAAITREMRKRTHVVQAVGELDEHDRMSCAIAITILRKFSACFSARAGKVILETLVAPSTRVATRRQRARAPRRAKPCVLDHVVQQTGYNRWQVELELGDDERDVERMGDVRLA